MTGLKGQRKPAPGKFASANAVLGSGRHHVPRPEGARVGTGEHPRLPRPFRADSSFAPFPQGGAALALGYSPLPLWGKRVAKTDAARPTLPNAVTATETLRSATIDALVYDLSGLTADEIKLVEGGGS